MGSHGVICHPTEVTAPAFEATCSAQPQRNPMYKPFNLPSFSLAHTTHTCTASKKVAGCVHWATLIVLSIVHGKSRPMAVQYGMVWYVIFTGQRWRGWVLIQCDWARSWGFNPVPSQQFKHWCTLCVDIGACPMWWGSSMLHLSTSSAQRRPAVSTVASSVAVVDGVSATLNQHQLSLSQATTGS